jgi:hypothetical protein
MSRELPYELLRRLPERDLVLELIAALINRYGGGPPLKAVLAINGVAIVMAKYLNDRDRLLASNEMHNGALEVLPEPKTPMMKGANRSR